MQSRLNTDGVISLRQKLKLVYIMFQRHQLYRVFRAKVKTCSHENAINFKFTIKENNYKQTHIPMTFSLSCYITEVFVIHQLVWNKYNLYLVMTEMSRFI